MSFSLYHPDIPLDNLKFADLVDKMNINSQKCDKKMLLPQKNDGNFTVFER